jgi:dienelactone hydrolase
MARDLVRVLLMLLALAGPAWAEPAADLSDGRIGRIGFNSVTPSGPAQFLAGSAPATSITGLLDMPEGAQGRIPAMVISHGSGGILPEREEEWAARLRAWGVATFVVDSFGPRGLGPTGEDQSRLPLAASVADALHALRLLATHPRIDPGRIGIMGFSKGGQVALYTALDPFRRAVMGAEGPRFALHVALYASCSIPYLGTPISAAPILLLLGGADDLTPAAHCARYADWLRAEGGDVRVLVLEGAHHGFDLPTPPRRLGRLQSARGCGLDLHLDPVEGRRWSGGQVLRGPEIGAYLRGCMQRGATFGGDPAALAQALREVEAAVGRMAAR